MKKIFFVLILVLCCAKIGFADTIKVPDLQAGIVYSIPEGKVEACYTATLLSYPISKVDVQLRGGYVTENEPIGAIACNIKDLNSLGVTGFLSNVNISLGGYAGYRFNNEDYDYGVIASASVPLEDIAKALFGK